MFWRYMVQSAFETVWSIKGLWWITKLSFITLYTALCYFVALFFKDVLGVCYIILLALISLDYAIFIVRFALACFGASYADKTRERVANASGALLLIKMVIRVLDVFMLLTACVILVQQMANPLALSIILLVVACLLAGFFFSKEFIYTIYKFVKYKAKKELEYIYDETKKDLIEETERFTQSGGDNN